MKDENEEIVRERHFMRTLAGEERCHDTSMAAYRTAFRDMLEPQIDVERLCAALGRVAHWAGLRPDEL